MSPSTIAFLLLTQSSGSDGSLQYSKTQSLSTPNGTSFAIYAYYPFDYETPLPSGVSFSAGHNNSDSAGSMRIGIGAGRAFSAVGTASYALSLKFYVKSTFNSDGSSLPPNVIFDCPKNEYSSASANVGNGDSASGSTSNSAASLPTSSPKPTYFSDDQSFSVSAGDWQAQGNGSYLLKKSLFTNDLSVTATHPQATYGQAGAGAIVVFNIANLVVVVH